MPDRGSLRLELAETTVGARDAARLGVAPGRFVVLAVTDSGAGMASEVSDRVFEPFFTTKQLGKGTGLGLATVYGIVKQNDGGIEVISSPGAGSTFRIYLPRHALPAEPPAKDPSHATSGAGLTVLLVDDDLQLLQVLRTQLRRLGYELLVAPNAESALATSAEHEGSIDLLITDLAMPGVDGRALAAALTARRPETRVLYMSGYSEHASVQTEATVEGALLAKPFSVAELTTAVREALGNTRSR
jgi:CheY-like chemotaxis protein